MQQKTVKVIPGDRPGNGGTVGAVCDMSNFYCAIGRFLAVAGGLLLCAALVALLMELCCEAWIAASNRFRDVCSGESLIREYKKNRKEFLEWKESKNRDTTQ